MPDWNSERVNGDAPHWHSRRGVPRGNSQQTIRGAKCRGSKPARQNVHRRHLERGSGSVLAVAIIGATVSIAVALCLVLAAHAANTRAQVAADAAALAAADTASGRIPGDACGRAAAIAAEHDATLNGCDAGRTETFVTVSLDFGWITLTASSRAGLPDSVP
ncbi:Rv3654c family TadE-like protein [Gulosibacter sediminis]|uniref:Rv3654c family TadE-like protein n=1 Tax=Gulosibacter sediminis TaxID=1729695 RepID=UPI0024A8284F|nr:Rv3654c family TadE-like protein [Gulosibacter sediminis]